MYHTVMIPTDGRSETESAAIRGIDLARTADAAVHTLYVVEPRIEPPDLGSEERAELRSTSEKRGRNATTTIRERAVDVGLEAHREIREGVPLRVILEYVRENDIDLVVMGTRGQTEAERPRLGRTAERVITLADVPVMAVPPSAADEGPESGYGMYDHVVIPTDGSDVAERASKHGLEIAERYGADVHLVYVVDTTTFGLEDAPRSIVGLLKEGGQTAVEAIAADARDRNLPVATDVLRGVPEEEIRDYATGVNADLIVMGTRGRTGGSDRLLGSTTARIVRRSEIPVLTIS